LHAFLLGFGVIFAAELGDKSQLIVLTFATRYRAVPLLVAIAIAAACIHGLSVGVGAALGAALPTRAMSAIAGLAFVGFAWWTMRGADDDDGADDNRDRTTPSAVAAAGLAFFVAELGDKTMLATITLASREALLATWAGATLGMLTADGIALVVGQVLGARLPARAIKVGASVAFFVLGLALLVDAARS
jgi:putative Ca2+/H+ antiporter (TMEM165/GDT1 family)